MPTWSTILVTVNNQTFSQTTDASEISNWSQSMSVQDGMVQTKYDWTPGGGNGSNSSTNITLSYTVLAHKVIPTLGAVYLSVSGLTNQTQVAFTDVLDVSSIPPSFSFMSDPFLGLTMLSQLQGRGAWRTDPVSQGPVPNTTHTIHSAVRPNGISNVTAYEVSLFDSWSSTNGWSIDSGANCAQNGALSSNASTASQCYRPMRVPADGKIDMVKYVGIVSSDAYRGVELSTALKSAQNANSTGWDALVKSHQAAWAKVWDDADIVIPGEEHTELQIATRASMFHLITNVRLLSFAFGGSRC